MEFCYTIVLKKSDGPSLHLWAGEAASGWAKCGVKNASEENHAGVDSWQVEPRKFSWGEACQILWGPISQSQENLTTEGEVHAGSSKDDALFGIDGDLPVCPEVIEATLGWQRGQRGTCFWVLFGASVITELQAGAGSLCGLRVKGKTFRFLSVFSSSIPILIISPRSTGDSKKQQMQISLVQKTKCKPFFLIRNMCSLQKIQKISEMHKEGNPRDIY